MLLVVTMQGRRRELPLSIYGCRGAVRPVCAGLLGLLAAGGCARQAVHYEFLAGGASGLPRETPRIETSFDDVRMLPMFAGRTGAALSWGDVARAGDWADVVIVGEQHDDPMGHAAERTIVETIATAQCGHRDIVLSMEMLERDEQRIIDDYMDGIIDSAALAKLTLSENWGGDNGWAKWYQPVIDAARAADARIVAANAPRRYVRLARTDGYERLRALPRQRRALFELPRIEPSAEYRDRFSAAMREGHESPAKSSAAPDSKPATAAALQESRGFDAQRVWDATMADSIARALVQDGATGHARRMVIHVVGQFHSDFEGGLVQELRARRRGVKVVVISMQREDARELRAEDHNRADVIIYTGKQPEPEPPPPAPHTGDQAPAADSPPASRGAGQ